MSKGTVWYLTYYDIPLCLGNKVPIHSDKKEEFDNLAWITDKHPEIKAKNISVKQMNKAVFNAKTWPGQSDKH